MAVVFDYFLESGDIYFCPILLKNGFSLSVLSFVSKEWPFFVGPILCIKGMVCLSLRMFLILLVLFRVNPDY